MKDRDLMPPAEYEAMFQTEDNMWWYVALREALVWWLHREVPAGSLVLDAGCGTGKNLEVLRKAGCRTIGCDPSVDAVCLSRRRFPDGLQRASIASLPFADATFDAVICMDVLGILDEAPRTAAVREMWRVLRPGGVAVLHVSALEWLRSPHDDFINWRVRFTRSLLLALLNQAGPWEVLSCGYRVCLLFPLVAAAKIGRKVASLLTRRPPASDQHSTPGRLNGLLLAVQLLEHRLFRHLGAPIGSSLLAVLRKPKH